MRENPAFHHNAKLCAAASLLRLLHNQEPWHNNYLAIGFILPGAVCSLQCVHFFLPSVILTRFLVVIVVRNNSCELISRFCSESCECKVWVRRHRHHRREYVKELNRFTDLRSQFCLSQILLHGLGIAKKMQLI